MTKHVTNKIDLTATNLATGEATETVKREIDWVQIQSHYRAGLLSVREIAASQGISHTAIQNRAKAEKWERDLKAKVQAKADVLVAKHEVASIVASETGVSDNLIVETNAKVISDIRIEHRAHITKMKCLYMTMLAQLELETENLELFAKSGELLLDSAAADASDALKKCLDALNKTLSLSSRIDNLKKLANILKILISLEREAYGITEIHNPNQPTNPQGNIVPLNTDWKVFKTRILAKANKN